MSLPSIQRVFLESVASADPDGRFVIVNDIQTYYKVAYPRRLETPRQEPFQLTAEEQQQSEFLPDDPSRPVIVLLHHFLGNLYTWRFLAQPLADVSKCPVVYFDRPAFGFTERPMTWQEHNNPYTLEFGVDFTLMFLNAIGYGGRQLALIGCSAGTTISCGIVLKYPGLVKAIVMLGAALQPQDQGPPPVARTILTSMPGRFFLKAALYRYMPFTMMYNDTSSMPHWDSIIKPCYRVPLTLPNFFEALSYTMKYFQPLSIYEHREQIFGVVPILYVVGDNDKYMPGDVHLNVYNEFKPSSKNHAPFDWLMLPLCGHLPQDERPGDILNASIDFFKSVGIF